MRFPVWFYCTLLHLVGQMIWNIITSSSLWFLLICFFFNYSLVCNGSEILFVKADCEFYITMILSGLCLLLSEFQFLFFFNRPDLWFLEVWGMIKGIWICLGCIEISWIECCVMVHFEMKPDYRFFTLVRKFTGFIGIELRMVSESEDFWWPF